MVADASSNTGSYPKILAAQTRLDKIKTAQVAATVVGIALTLTVTAVALTILFAPVAAPALAIIGTLGVGTLFAAAGGALIVTIALNVLFVCLSQSAKKTISEEIRLKHYKSLAKEEEIWNSLSSIVKEIIDIFYKDGVKYEDLEQFDYQLILQIYFKSEHLAWLKIKKSTQRVDSFSDEIKIGIDYAQQIKELKEILPEKKQARIIALLHEIEEELDRTNYFDDMA